MITSKRVGILLLVIGVIMVAVSALADPIGIGSGGSEFGWKQTVGVGIGAILLVAGAIALVRGQRPIEDEQSTARPTQTEVTH